MHHHHHSPSPSTGRCFATLRRRVRVRCVGRCDRGCRAVGCCYTSARRVKSRKIIITIIKIIKITKQNTEPILLRCKPTPASPYDFFFFFFLFFGRFLYWFGVYFAHFCISVCNLTDLFLWSRNCSFASHRVAPFLPFYRNNVNETRAFTSLSHSNSTFDSQWRWLRRRLRHQPRSTGQQSIGPQCVCAREKHQCAFYPCYPCYPCVCVSGRTAVRSIGHLFFSRNVPFNKSTRARVPFGIDRCFKNKTKKKTSKINRAH